jgi:HD-like signal output (HDOD) protein
LATSHNSRVGAYDRLSHLPAFHPTAMKLLAISSEADSAITDFEGVFKADPALAADLLLMANSAAFGGRARVEAIRHALTLLGLERVRAMACNIMLAAYVKQLPAEQIRPIWLHGIATAVVCEILGKSYNIHGMYTVGLLHDLGRLGLLLSGGPRYAELLAAEVAGVSDAIEQETALCGMNHCDAGALLALTWGFPEILQVAMVEHHGDRAVGSGSPVGLVQIACRMADWLGFAEVKRQDLAPPILPQRVLDSPDLEPERVLDQIKKQSAILV